MSDIIEEVKLWLFIGVLYMFIIPPYIFQMGKGMYYRLFGIKHTRLDLKYGIEYRRTDK